MKTEIVETIIAEINGHLNCYPTPSNRNFDHFQIGRLYKKIGALADQAGAENREFYGLGDMADEAMAVIDEFFSSHAGDYEKRYTQIPVFAETGLTPRPEWLS